MDKSANVRAAGHQFGTHNLTHREIIVAAVIGAVLGVGLVCGFVYWIAAAITGVFNQ